MNLIILENKYAIYRFSNDFMLPDWIYSPEFYSVTRTSEELSVVAIQNDSVDGDLICNKDWRIIKVEGPLDFKLTGIIAGISAVLSNRGISIFTISTYDTDYILVKQIQLDNAIEALSDNGYTFSPSQ